MKTGLILLRPKAVALAAIVCIGAVPAIVWSAETSSNHPILSYGNSRDLARQGSQSDLLDQQMIHPGTPMVLDPMTGALEFNLGGSETRKLQLQLSHPITVDAGHYLLSPASDSAILGLDATLRMPLGKGLSLHGGAEQLRGNTQFQTLGSIQCLNGTLGPDFYTASGCHFVSEASPTFDRRTLNLGASREFGNMSASVNWFTTETSRGAAGVNSLNHVDPSILIENRLLAPFAGGGVSSGNFAGEYFTSETTGVDLNFQLGFATDQAGEVRLGLALTRVLDANYQGIYGHGLGQLDWNVVKPFDSAAFGIEWSRGSFSSGIGAYYREPISFLNHENLDSMSTFDVHFTWRAPWKANLSVGTSNILGAGVDKGNSIDKSTDRFESIYGRIPYVRYQQDL